MLSAKNARLIFFISIVIGIISIAGVATLIGVWLTKLTPFIDFAIVVDAGSTHSKLFLYYWPADKSDGLGVTSKVQQKRVCDVPGGPLTSIEDPTLDTTKAYFDSAMTTCINDIAKNRKNRALIYLGGTAGLRLFEMNNASYTNTLLNATRDYFNTLGLHFKSPQDQVRIINGSEEGLSGWISTNILMEELFKNHEPLDTYGVSDIGGASTQLSFVSPNATHEHFNMNLFDTDYDVYSHSYLCYGAEQIRRIYLGQMVNEANGSLELYDPCLQEGYAQNITYDYIFSTACARDKYAPLPDLNTSSTYLIMGTGNYDGCLNAIQQRFNTSICTYSNCSFNNVYQPKPIPPSLKFIAMSAWYSTFNSLAPNVSLIPNKDGNYDFNTVNFTHIKSAIASVCNQSWFELNSTDPYRPLLCFNSMYHWTLLEYGYSMTDENLKNFHIVKKIQGSDIGWTLGYMINQTNYLNPELRPPRLLTKNEFAGLLSFCLIVLVISIIAVILSKRFSNNPTYEIE